VREGSKFISPIASSNWTCIQHDLFHFFSLSLSLSLSSPLKADRVLRVVCFA
jgi:hypothetical protein